VNLGWRCVRGLMTNRCGSLFVSEPDLGGVSGRCLGLASGRLLRPEAPTRAADEQESCHHEQERPPAANRPHEHPARRDEDHGHEEEESEQSDAEAEAEAHAL
jgi:hypothetical protein